MSSLRLPARFLTSASFNSAVPIVGAAELSHEQKMANGHACLEIFDRMTKKAALAIRANRQIMIVAAGLLVNGNVEELVRLEQTLISADEEI